ncbi:MAG: carbamoyl-phosphate synthase (glutamine-hydrolyzing) small subunit [Candidatus Hydrogenedentota bacterium]|nr:MAG: carbamoyl-phosphate synthase (glutamine-hydrolyzing) small subunit [Candidatus Hydrogenedentota bacterium]
MYWHRNNKFTLRYEFLFCRMSAAVLVLEDGNFFTGKALGKWKQEAYFAETVFNTAMSGYQEIITDPSYKGQFVCFTYPSIGNYGCNTEDYESDKPYLSGIILKDYPETYSNFRANESLVSFLEKYEVPALTSVDTRALVKHIREAGAMRSGIFLLPNNWSPYKIHLKKEFHEWLKEKKKAVQSSPSMEGSNLVSEFRGQEVQTWLHSQAVLDGPKIAVLDFGIKRNILRNFLSVGLNPILFPGDTPMDKWQNFNPDEIAGYFFSNGPGDPSAVKTGIQNIQKILTFKKPIFGICLGHQMLSIALGAKTHKMKFGHHGGNQPVKAEENSHVYITSQNHGFAAEEATLKTALNQYEKVILEKNPNDNSIEGFRVYGKQPIISVQYHPEACPGPRDAEFIFREFAELVKAQADTAG